MSEVNDLIRNSFYWLRNWRITHIYLQVIERGMQNGYHTAKVEWIKDEPIPPEELGNMLFSLISDIIGND